MLIARYKEIYGFYLKENYCKVVFQAVFCFFGSYSFPYRSLLLGTNVPNDIPCSGNFLFGITLLLKLFYREFFVVSQHPQKLFNNKLKSLANLWLLTYYATKK